MGLRLLDLCCGAGGAAMGYANMGFEVVGVDNKPQPHYPFEFHRADARNFPLDGFDCVHASPPCQAWSVLANMWEDRRPQYPQLIMRLRTRFWRAGLPYVIENVPGAPLTSPVMLCGSMFGLRCERGWLRRHRMFECSFPVDQPECDHPQGEPAVGVYGHGGYSGKHRMLNAADARIALDIDWMSRDEMTQCIPPAYAEYIGGYLKAHILQLRESESARNG